MKPGHILIPTDLSDEFEKLALWVDCFSEMGICNQATFLHFPPITFASSPFSKKDEFPDSLIEAYMNRAHDVMEEKMNRKWKGKAKINAEIISAGNQIAKNLSAYLNKNIVDLIILSSKSRGKGAFSGSRLKEIIKKVNVPCMVIGNEPPKPGFRIGFASDLTKPSVLVFKDLAEFAKVSHSTVLPFFVNTPDHFISQPEFREKSMGFVRETNNKDRDFVNLFNASVIEEGIQHFGEDHLCDMLALTYQESDSKLNRLFRGSVTESLVADTDFCIIVFPAPKLRSQG